MKERFAIGTGPAINVVRDRLRGSKPGKDRRASHLGYGDRWSDGGRGVGIRGDFNKGEFGVDGCRAGADGEIAIAYGRDDGSFNKGVVSTARQFVVIVNLNAFCQNHMMRIAGGDRSGIGGSDMHHIRAVGNIDFPTVSRGLLLHVKERIVQLKIG